MRKTKILCLTLGVGLGIFFFIYGGYDDSPGAQLLGLFVTLASVIGIVRVWRK